MTQSLIVFSHLRWDFVYQRPQHLMQRLAERYNIYFFEEPVLDNERTFLEMSTPAPNVTVCRPHLPVATSGFHDEHIPLLQNLLEQLVEDQKLQDYGVWFYSPMALPLMKPLKPAVVIYDCMDELSAFKNAPKQLLQRESALIKVADVVFTGGPSLFRAKRDRHPSVHCFPSSVDALHFGKAKSPEAEHAMMQSLPHPRIGFFGVIDERIDLPMLAHAANARPDWQFVMVGPHVKIDPATLPQGENIHYYGQQSYADLPSFVAGWDVCMQPFALNESTRFISPTKTLEYMAASRPIVSTPITDVVDPYSDVVFIADNADAFIDCCEQALNEDADQCAIRSEAMQSIIANTSWDSTATAMHHLIADAWRTPGEVAMQRGFNNIVPTQIVPTESVSIRVDARQIKDQIKDYETIILGAGPTGLSAGYHLGEGSLVLEQHETIGGWCRSIEDHGFTFDYAGHIMFSNDEYVHSLYKKLLGDNIHWQNREAWIYSKQVYTRYPFQGALFGLPADVLKDCIVGAIEARFGSLKPAPIAAKLGDMKHSSVASNSSSASLCKAESITDCCADGIAESTVPLAQPTQTTRSHAEPENFEEFIYRVWGTGVAKHFAIPYNKKIWAVPLNEMETSWLGGRVPLPNLEEMVEGALSPVPRPQGPNARFGYPLRGGFQALMGGFTPLMRGDVLTNSKVTHVNAARHMVTLANGRQFRYETLISTAPLPALIAMLGERVPAHIRSAVALLRHTSVRCVNLGVARENITDKHWIYYPEDTVFHRIFVQGNASPHCNAPGGFALTCEITYAASKPLPCDGDELIDRCIRECIEVGLLRPDDRIIARNQVDMPYAYVVYDMERKKSVKVIREWLQAQDIVLAGRYSEWEYYNSDHAFIAGQKIAERVRETQRSIDAEAATTA